MVGHQKKYYNPSFYRRLALDIFITMCNNIPMSLTLPLSTRIALATKRVAEHTCPTCSGTTRSALKGGKLTRVCNDPRCTWSGLHMAAEEAEARAAIEARKVGVAA